MFVAMINMKNKHNGVMLDVLFFILCNCYHDICILLVAFCTLHSHMQTLITAHTLKHSASNLVSRSLTTHE